LSIRLCAGVPPCGVVEMGLPEGMKFSALILYAVGREGQTHSTQRPEQASRSTRRPKPHWKKFFASFFQKRSAFFLFFFEKKNQKTFG
jgi:hypothetical protein